MKSMRAVEAGAEFLLAGQRGWNHYHSISKDINIVDNRALQQFHLSKSVYLLTQAVKKTAVWCLMWLGELKNNPVDVIGVMLKWSLKVVGIRKKRKKVKSESWKLLFSLSLSLYFLLNIFPPWWETVGRRERTIFGTKSVRSLQEQEFVPFPGTVKIHLNKSRRNMCKLGLG